MVGKIKLVVAIEDDIYLDRLCDYLETEHGRFLTQRFSDRDALTAFLNSNPDYYDLLLVEPGMIDQEQLQGIQRIKILLGTKDVFEETEGCYCLREYQKIEGIASGILKICSFDQRFMGIDLQASGRARFYVFTSPVGGAGVTTVALATGLHLAQAGKKVLYIGMEQISTVDTLLHQDGLTMTQVMRMAIERNPKLPTAIEGGKNVEPLSGLEYFGGFHDVTDLDALEPEHLKRLGEQLPNFGSYDAILLDLPWNTRLFAALLEKAEKIFLVSRNTNLSVERVNRFLRYANEKELSYRNRIQVVMNAANGSVNSRLMVAPTGAIPMSPMLIDTVNFAATALTGGGFSAAVEELARQF